MKNGSPTRVLKSSPALSIKVWLFLLAMVCGSASMAQAEYFNLAWGLQYGSATDDDYSGIDIDSSGYIYHSWKAIDGSTTTTYMKKLDRMGNLVWLKSEQRNYIEMTGPVKIDSQNNYCVFGYTYGPSGGSYYGSCDGFIRKYNSDGQLLWATQLGSSGYEAILNGTIDSQGNVYAIGEYSGQGAVVTKYDQNGNCQWQKYYKFYGDEQGNDIRVSTTGDIYFGLGFGGSSGPANQQVALLKLNQNGDLLWKRDIGVAGVPDGMFRIGGFDTQGRVVFQVGTNGALGGTHLGGWDIAVGRCDSSGNIEWIGQYGTPADDLIGNFVMGSSDSMITVGLTVGSLFCANQGNYDGFIMQIAANGNLLGGSQFGTAGDDIFAILCSNGTDYYVVGWTSSSFWGPSSGGHDVILGKFNLDPTNDEKENAIAVQAGSVVNGWTVGATGTDITLNGYNDSKDVWYYFEPAAAGKYTIQLYDSTFDTTLGVFDANNKEVVFNDDFWGEKSVVILKAKAGKRYYIRVAGYDEEVGDFTLSVEAGAMQAIQGDLNYDGVVDMNDLSALAQNWLMGGN